MVDFYLAFTPGMRASAHNGCVEGMCWGVKGVCCLTDKTAIMSTMILETACCFVGLVESCCSVFFCGAQTSAIEPPAVLQISENTSQTGHVSTFLWGAETRSLTLLCRRGGGYQEPSSQNYFNELDFLCFSCTFLEFIYPAFGCIKNLFHHPSYFPLQSTAIGSVAQVLAGRQLSNWLMWSMGCSHTMHLLHLNDNRRDLQWHLSHPSSPPHTHTYGSCWHASAWMFLTVIYTFFSQNLENQKVVNLLLWFSWAWPICVACSLSLINQSI